MEWAHQTRGPLPVWSITPEETTSLASGYGSLCSVVNVLKKLMVHNVCSIVGEWYGHTGC